MTDDPHELIRVHLREAFERELSTRVERYTFIQHQRIVPNHYFAIASSECINLYRDGYFISCVSMTQAVAEAIVRFVSDRNGIKRREKESKLAMIARMGEEGVVSEEYVQAYGRIYGSERNHFHHMNPEVAGLDVEQMARANITDLALIEREIFGHSLREGMIVPHQRKYWDIQDDGGVVVYGRFA